MTSQLTHVPRSRPDAFDPGDLRVLPEPARRWLGHAMTPGAPLTAAIALRLHGEIRISRWRRFSANQVLLPDSGFVWWARTRVVGVPVSGYDAYLDGRGVMRWRAFGTLPVLRADGFDVTASAAGRLAGEAVLVPSRLVHAAIWHADPDPDAATFIDGAGVDRRHTPVTVRVAPDGQLLAVSLQRWGNPFGRRFGLHRFEVVFDGEYDAGHIRIGDRMRAAWLSETGERIEFYRAAIDDVTLLGPAEGAPRLALAGRSALRGARRAHDCGNHTGAPR